MSDSESPTTAVAVPSPENWGGRECPSDYMVRNGGGEVQQIHNSGRQCTCSCTSEGEGMRYVSACTDEVNKK